jgi:ElaB/YqjD/DUF883 family membrane-anchored ribosome-binding protein
MSDSVFDKASDHIAGAAQRASRVTSAVTDAFEDGVDMAKRAVKQSYDAAEEFLDDTQQRIKRHPVETVAAAFAIGAAFGLLVGLFARRK